jgi:ADP-heptose:LPS heptosyltransferase
MRLDGIGDYVLFHNFMEEIQNSNRFKDYTITLCGNENYKDLALACDRQVIKDFIWINTISFSYNLAYRYQALNEIRRRAFEIAINSVYSRESIVGDSIIRATHAKERIGYKGDFSHTQSWVRIIFNRYYTQLIDIAPTTHFEFYRIKEFFEKILSQPITLRKPTLQYMKRQAISSRFAVICSGASYSTRRWLTDKYIQVAEYVHQRYGMASIFVGGPQDVISDEELCLFKERPYLTNAIGTTTIVQTMELIQNASLVVSNDTSVAHIGAALNIPVVVISNGNHFGRFTEYPKEIYQHIYYAYPPEITSSKLSFSDLVKKYEYGSWLDINSIQVETVLQLINKALTSSKKIL